MIRCDGCDAAEGGLTNIAVMLPAASGEHNQVLFSGHLCNECQESIENMRNKEGEQPPTIRRLICLFEEWKDLRYPL